MSRLAGGTHPPTRSRPNPRSSVLTPAKRGGWTRRYTSRGVVDTSPAAAGGTLGSRHAERFQHLRGVVVVRPVDQAPGTRNDCRGRRFTAGGPGSPAADRVRAASCQGTVAMWLRRDGLRRRAADQEGSLLGRGHRQCRRAGDVPHDFRGRSPGEQSPLLRVRGRARRKSRRAGRHSARRGSVVVAAVGRQGRRAYPDRPVRRRAVTGPIRRRLPLAGRPSRSAQLRSAAAFVPAWKRHPVRRRSPHTVRGGRADFPDPPGCRKADRWLRPSLHDHRPSV
jgi:hypothetical protein